MLRRIHRCTIGVPSFLANFEIIPIPNLPILTDPQIPSSPQTLLCPSIFLTFKSSSSFVSAAAAAAAVEKAAAAAAVEKAAKEVAAEAEEKAAAATGRRAVGAEGKGGAEHGICLGHFGCGS